MKGWHMDVFGLDEVGARSSLSSFGCSLCTLILWARCRLTVCSYCVQWLSCQFALSVIHLATKYFYQSKAAYQDQPLITSVKCVFNRSCLSNWRGVGKVASNMCLDVDSSEILPWIASTFGHHFSFLRHIRYTVRLPSDRFCLELNWVGERLR